MSLLTQENSNKWIKSFFFICAALLGFVTYRFLLQLSDWFDLEAKIQSFIFVAQGTGLVVAIGAFAGLLFNKKTEQYVNEVYNELLKVVWPDSDSVVKLTFGIFVGLFIVSGILIAFDWVFRLLIDLIL
jgi:preprotein translocase subunit SecE